MGRRSRQRAMTPPRERAQQTVTAAAPPAAPITTAARRSRRDAAPAPPWGSFPLVELCALAAIVIGVWGILSRNGVLLTGAAVLGSVAGIEVALREHLGGYRSHSLLLAGTVTVATLALLLLGGVARGPVLLGGPLLLIAGFLVFRQLFKRRSGGAGMRVR